MKEFQKNKIFLSGGRDLEDAKALDGKFFDCLNSGSKILYIPKRVITK